MKNSLKDFEKFIEKEVETFVANDYKRKALEELKTLNSKCPNIEFIIEQYPDFNHLKISFSMKNQFIINICVNPDILKKDKKAIRSLAKTMRFFVGKSEEIKLRRTI